MKRHIQKTGVRKFFGQDFVDLQAEPLKALDAFFAEYGACLIEGCAITEADGGTFNVAPGLVALESTDPESGVVSVRTMPFAGAKGVALPLYLVAEWTVVERAYGDGKVKPIGYNLLAVASGIVPEGAHLVVTDAGGNRFVDAVQDPAHRFITDAERTKWNDILRQAKEYAVAQAQAEAAASQATAVGLAKAHTEGQVAAVRDELALGDQAALNTAKAYADRIVAALVDNSPELLNTLEELAGALGNDPNFATTVMTEIGKRATTTDLTTHTTSGTHVTASERNNWNSKVDSSALNAKADRNHGHTMAALSDAVAWWGEQFRAVAIGGTNLQVNGAFDRGTAGISGHNVAFAGLRANQYNEAFPLYGSTLLAIDWKSNSDCYVHLRDSIWAAVVRPNTTYTISWWQFDGGVIDEVSAIVYMNNAPSKTQKFACTYGWHRNVMTVTTKNDTNKMFLRLGCWIGGTAWSAVDGLQIEEGTAATAWGPSPYDIDTPKLDALPTKIIRGSVDADGNLLPGSNGIESCFKSGNTIRMYHRLGHTNFSATATVYSANPSLYDNVVSISAKTISYLEFVITEGPNNAIEWAPFDFIIIPW